MIAFINVSCLSNQHVMYIALQYMYLINIAVILAMAWCNTKKCDYASKHDTLEHVSWFLTLYRPGVFNL